MYGLTINNIDRDCDIDMMDASEFGSEDDVPQTEVPTRLPLVRRFTSPGPGAAPPALRFVHLWDSKGQDSLALNGTIATTVKDGIRFKLGATREKFVEIAHSEHHQLLFDQYNISWSVQWQIGVLISRGNLGWPQVTEEKVALLTGTNAQAGPKVWDVFWKKPGERRTTSAMTPSRDPWLELDREEDPESEGTMIGLKGDCVNEEMGSTWGGHVEQRATLVRKMVPSLVQPSGQREFDYQIQLHQQQVRSRSHRLARKFGSRRLIQLKISEAKDMKDAERRTIRNILQHGFLLHGRIFRPFSEHEGSVYLIETNENFGRLPNDTVGDRRRISFSEFIYQFNPMDQNRSQLVCKWSARFPLGLSTSIPAIIFRRENMIYIPDIISSSHDPTRTKPHSHHVMTDGCGQINRAALRAVQRHQGLSCMPVAVQGRIAGAKGLWVLHPTDGSDEAKIWVVESQVKIKYTSRQLDHPSNRILDLLRVSHVKTPDSLTTQPILNMAHNGVSSTVFNEIFQEALEAQVQCFMDEWQQEDVVRLWATVFSKAGLSGTRKARDAQMLRESFMGAENGTSDVEEAIDTKNPLNADLASLCDLDPCSGWPAWSLSEQVVALLAAGFRPQTCPLLATGLKTLMKSEAEGMVRPCRMLVDKSAEAFAVPDFLGILEPGQVFLRLSSQSQHCGLLEESDSNDGVVTGPLLIFRYPVRAPSDCQAVVAVNYRELFPFTDVLIFSTKGEQSGASLLAGGDYDGDTVHIFNDPRLLKGFVNANTRFAFPPDGFEENVEQETDTVRDLEHRISALSENNRHQELQRAIVESWMRPRYMGLYSTWADLAAYHLGYDADETQYLNHMFYSELDGAKSGKHVIPDVFEVDRSSYGKLSTPDCLKKRDAKIAEGLGVTRPSHLPEFVLDSLTPFASAQVERYRKLIDQLSTVLSADHDLLKPLEAAEDRARRLGNLAGQEMRKELGDLKTFVDRNRSNWKGLFTGESEDSPLQRVRRSQTITEALQDPRRDFSEFPRVAKLASKREISRQFAEDFDFDKLKYFGREEARAILASRAYMLESTRTEYPFLVGFNQLAMLKSRATGGWGVISHKFHSVLVPRHGLRGS